MIRIVMVKDGQFQKLSQLKDIKEKEKTANLIWAAGLELTLEEQEELSHYLAVDSKSLKRLLEQLPRGHYHRFYNYSAIHIPMFVEEPFIQTVPVLLLIHENLIVTVCLNMPQKAVDEVEETIRNLIESGGEVSPSLVAVRFVQEIIELNANAIRRVVTPIRELGEQFEKVDITHLLSRFTELRRIEGETYQLLLEQRNTIDLMLQHVPRHLVINFHLTTLLNAVQNELERQQQTLEFQSRALTDLISLQSIFLANRLNRVIVFLTAITVTITLPSLIANIFGMWGIFHPYPLFYLFGSTPIYAWQLEFLVLIPAIIIPLTWVLRKGWIKILS